MLKLEIKWHTRTWWWWESKRKWRMCNIYYLSSLRGLFHRKLFLLVFLQRNPFHMEENWSWLLRRDCYCFRCPELNLQTRKVLELSHSLLSLLSQLLLWCKTIKKQEERIRCSNNTRKTFSDSPRPTRLLYCCNLSSIYIYKLIPRRKNSLVVLVNWYPFIFIGLFVRTASSNVVNW